MRNREQWLHQWELIRKLTKLAEEAKVRSGESVQGNTAYTSA